MADKIIGFTETPREWLKANYVNKHVELAAGIYCGHDFRPFMKRFVYQYYDWWFTCYAPSKTLLRRAWGSGVGEVHEIPKK